MQSIDLIWRWLDDVVIGENFCPFAKKPRQDGEINIRVINEEGIISVLEQVLDELHWLHNNNSKRTSLIVLEFGFDEFYDYLDLLDAVDALIDAEGFTGIFQCASFHPQYLFEGEDANDTSHYTNRSPLPILHIIREEDITSALASFSRPESIPERNKIHARQLGKAFFKEYLRR